MTRSATAGLPDLKSYMNLYKPLQRKKILYYIKSCLTYDLYLRENVKKRPDFAGDYTLQKDELRYINERDIIKR